MLPKWNSENDASKPSLQTRTKAILANTLGTITAFFGAPLGYTQIRPAVVAFTEEHYWLWLTFPVSWALFIVIAVLLFGLTRLIFDNGLSSAQAYWATRQG